MAEFLHALRWTLLASFRPRARVEAENLALRHQLIVLRRQAPRRLPLSGSDRFLFVWLYRLWPGVLASIVIVNPETVVRWRRGGFKAFWRWKSEGHPGRPKIPAEVRTLIRQVSLANPLWGAPRIHGELLKVGIDLAQSTVAKNMSRSRRPISQSWKTFLRNHAGGIASLDFLVVPSAAFRPLFGLVILRHDRRRLAHVAATANPTAGWIARQISEAFPWDTAPKRLIRDRDGVCGPVFRRRLSAMGIRDRPTAPRSPWQNGYVEPLVGSTRRECLDHLIILGETDSCCVLTPIITTASELTCLSAKTRHILARFSDMAKSNSSLISAVCTDLWRGCDFRQGRRSYGAALGELGLAKRHETGGRLNNRAENSHQPVRRRERSWIGFKGPGSTQRFLSAHAAVYNCFNLQRHLISRRTLREFRDAAFAEWRTAVQAA